STGLPGCRGVLRTRQPDGLPPMVNPWLFVEYDPPFRAVIEQHFVMGVPPRTVRVTVFETNLSRRYGCSLKRTMRYELRPILPVGGRLVGGFRHPTLRGRVW